MSIPAVICLAATVVLGVLAVAYAVTWLCAIAGILILAAAAALGWSWKEPCDGHADLMAGLGYPAGRLPRRWTRKDWAELDALTETAKD